MNYGHLPLKTLRDIAKAYKVSPTGRKAELVQRLIAYTMDNPGEDVWLLFTEDHLDRFIAALGLDATQATSHQGKAALLAAVPDLTTNAALQALLAHQQASLAVIQQAPPPQAEVKLQLTKQVAAERTEDFLDRARTHFDLVNATDAQAITLLVNAALPPVAAYVTQNYRAGVNTIEAMLNHVANRFAPNKFQYYDQFKRYKLTAGQSARDAGNDLRRIFTGFLGLPAAQLHTHEQVVRDVVTAQLVEILPSTTATMMRAELLRHPNMEWTAVLELADQLLQSSARTAPGDVKPTRPREQQHCSLHGLGLHSTAECRTQRYQAANQARPPSQTQHGRPYKPPICFTCGKEGHMASHCPTLQNQTKENC